MTKKQAIREFCSYACEAKVVFSRERYDNNWGMDTDNKVPRLTLPRTFPSSLDDADKAFRKDFIQRCPIAQGFSYITLTLLHECGHWATRSVMDIVEYNKQEKKTSNQIEYMQMPWERLATEWAICWLNIPANRQMAKRFERNYFDY